MARGTRATNALASSSAHQDGHEQDHGETTLNGHVSNGMNGKGSRTRKGTERGRGEVPSPSTVASSPTKPTPTSTNTRNGKRKRDSTPTPSPTKASTSTRQTRRGSALEMNQGLENGGGHDEEEEEEGEVVDEQDSEQDEAEQERKIGRGRGRGTIKRIKLNTGGIGARAGGGGKPESDLQANGGTTTKTPKIKLKIPNPKINDSIDDTKMDKDVHEEENDADMDGPNVTKDSNDVEAELDDIQEALVPDVAADADVDGDATVKDNEEEAPKKVNWRLGKKGKGRWKGKGKEVLQPVQQELKENGNSIAQTVNVEQTTATDIPDPVPEADAIPAPATDILPTDIATETLPAASSPRNRRGRPSRASARNAVKQDPSSSRTRNTRGTAAGAGPMSVSMDRGGKEGTSVGTVGEEWDLEVAVTEGDGEKEKMDQGGLLGPGIRKDLVAVLETVNVSVKSKNLLEQRPGHSSMPSLKERLQMSESMISLEKLENLLYRLTSDLYPASTNPFHSAGAGPQTGPSTRCRKIKIKTATDDEYLLSIKRVIDSFSRYIQGKDSAIDSIGTPAIAPTPIVKWHLHQRLPIAGPSRPPRGIDPAKWVPPPPTMQEWYSSMAVLPDPPKDEKDVNDPDSRRHTRSETVKDVEEVAEEEAAGVIEHMFQRSAFGKANPVFPAAGDFEEEAPTLGEVLLMKATLKAKTWKARNEPRGEMGFSGHAVKFLRSKANFTPSFAPVYDSSKTTGGWGYYSSVDVARNRTNSRAWLQDGWGSHFGQDWKTETGQEGNSAVHVEADSMDGVSDADSNDESSSQVVPKEEEKASAVLRQLFDEEHITPELVKTFAEQQGYSDQVQQILNQNARWMEELVYWKEVRIRRGSGDVPGEKESETAAKLARSLQHLATLTAPSRLLNTKPSRSNNVGLSSSTDGFASRWARVAIPGKTPVYKGTLDPTRRTRALADNLTFAEKPEQVLGAGMPSMMGSFASARPILPLSTSNGNGSVPGTSIWTTAVSGSGIGAQGRLEAQAGNMQSSSPKIGNGIASRSAGYAIPVPKVSDLPFPSGRIPNPTMGATPQPMYPPPNPYGNKPYTPFVDVGRTTRVTDGIPRKATAPPAPAPKMATVPQPPIPLPPARSITFSPQGPTPSQYHASPSPVPHLLPPSTATYYGGRMPGMGPPGMGSPGGGMAVANAMRPMNGLPQVYQPLMMSNGQRY